MAVHRRVAGRDGHPGGPDRAPDQPLDTGRRIAGLLLIADGVTFVASRTALLDGFLVFFVVAAFGALIVDRDQVRERMHIALLDGRIHETPWGPRLGVRWWRFGAGVLLGLACATKWSGLYFVVFFGLMSLAFDVAARRQYGCRGRGWAPCAATWGRRCTRWG